MNRKKLDRAVGETTHAATDLGKEALALATAYLQQAQEQLAPRAKDALQQASDRIGPIAKDARKRGAKLAADAMDAARPKLDEALDRVTPAVDNAYARLAPAIDTARSKVQDEILPSLSQALHEAADDITAVELPEVPAPRKRRSVWGTIGRVLLAGGLLAGVVYALKRFLAPADSGWQAHEPSQPYVPTTTQNLADNLAAQAAGAKDAAAQWAQHAGTTVKDKVDDLSAAAAEDLAKATEDAAEAVEKATEGDDADPFVVSPYGEGSYVGTTPPEGYVIKGNERSMKFHVRGNGGYERTIADVWFNSEAAAEAAGFTKAQR